MIKDLAIVTWSHTSYSDIWDMYYKQFEKMAPFFKHYMFINEKNDKTPDYCHQIVNNEKQKFGERVCFSLEHVKEQNVIWMQEDFVLYDKVEKQKIEMLNDFLNNSDFSFVRLMKSGVFGGESIDENLGIFEIPKHCAYLYCLQAAIWKKKDLLKLMSYYKPKNMMQAELQGSYSFLQLGFKGAYVYNNEKPRGNLHHDSSVFPYVSTALHGGSHGRPAKWQTNIYPKILPRLINEYGIDINIRGEIKK